MAIPFFFSVGTAFHGTYKTSFQAQLVLLCCIEVYTSREFCHCRFGTFLIVTDFQKLSNLVWLVARMVQVPLADYHVCIFRSRDVIRFFPPLYEVCLNANHSSFSPPFIFIALAHSVSCTKLLSVETSPARLSELRLFHTADWEHFSSKEIALTN